MENQNPNDQVSTLKKTITTIVVVGVLVVSAITINSVQSRASLEAQTGFFSRLFSGISNIFRFNNDNERLTFADSGVEYGNYIDDSSVGKSMVFNMDNVDSSSQVGVVTVDSDGVVYIPEEDSVAGLVEDSYIITFKSDPIALKTKDVLLRNGVELSPVKNSQEELRSALNSVKGEIDNHRARINAEQQKLLIKVNGRFGAGVNTGNNTYEYQNTDRTVKLRQLKTASNAVTISNISEEDLIQITRGISDIVSIEKAKLVKADLLETSDIINSIDLQNYLGANGVPLTGEGTTIAIVDTGVDYTHQDLGACSFLEASGCKVVGGYDFINDDPDPMDDHGHGTHVAATAAGDGFWTDSEGNINPLPGIAPDAKILAFKVLSAAGSGSSISVIAGIEACVDPNGDGLIDDKATVCSLSLGAPGGSPTDSQSLAADAASEAGVIMTIAAGNNGPGMGTVGTPGTSRKAVTVGASCKPGDVGNDTRCNESVASFSSRGPVLFTDENGQPQVLNKPDIVSPGVNICAAQWGDWMDNKSCLGDGEHISINGTSMATPTVAGLMALLAQAHPNKSVEELKNILMATATDLNLPVEVQGQGLVDGLAALEAAGIPNTILQIEGLPFLVNDNSSEQVSSFTQTLELTNITDSALNLTAVPDGVSNGVTLNFQESFSINPGQTFDFPVEMVIDHTIAPSGSHKERIVISNGLEDVTIVITRNTPKLLVSQFDKMDFGLFHESESNYSKTLDLSLTNRMSNQSLSYNISFDESELPTSVVDNIEYTSNVNEVNLLPNETQVISIDLSAFSIANNLLPNKKYKVNLQISSDTETVVVPLTFFRGYAFSFDYESGVIPDVVLLESPTWQFGYYPNPSLDYMTLYATQPGPYFAVAVYGGNVGDKKIQTAIFTPEINLQNSIDVVHYDVSKNKAEHQIDNQFFGNACFWRWSERQGKYDFGFGGGGEWLFEYNDILGDVSFSAICGDLKPVNKKVSISQIYLTENLNQDFVLNEDTAETSTRYVYGFNNFENHTDFSIGMTICNFIGYDYQGGVNSGYNFCYFWQNNGGKTLDISEGQSAALEVHSLHTETPETSMYPDYPRFRLHLINQDASGNSDEGFMLTSAPMFATQNKLYAWNDQTTGIFTTTDSYSDFYNKNKIDVINDNFVTIGVGPVSDSFTPVVYRDDFVGSFYNEYSKIESPYIYADGSSERTTLPSSPYSINALFDFIVNDSEYSVSNLINRSLNFQIFPDIDGNFSSYTPPAFGNYVVNIVRSALFGGVQDNSHYSIFEFGLNENGATDSVPPIIENIQLIGGGLLQNYFDASLVNELRIKMNPGYGLQYHSLNNNNGAYDIDFFNDNFSSVSLYVGDTVDSLQEMSLTETAAGYFVANLESLGGGGDFKYFQIMAIDTFGNSREYNFRIPTGVGLIEEELVNPDLLVCSENPPTVSISPMDIVLEEGGASVPVDITFYNNNSAACDPLSSSVFTFNTTANIPVFQNQKVRGTSNPNFGPTGNFNTTGFTLTLSADDLSSGDPVTKTVWFKADAGLYDYIYNVQATLTSYSQEFDPVNINIPMDIDSEIPHPASCGIETPTLNIFDFDNIHDVGDTTTHSFMIELINNDNPACSSTSFNLQVSDSSEMFATNKIVSIWTPDRNFNDTFISVAPGEVRSDVVYYKSFSDEPASVNLNLTLAAINETFLSHDVVEESVSVYYGQDVPEEVPAYCAADFNQDGSVNTGDQVLFNANFGLVNPVYDLNGSGGPVNTGDLLLFLEYFNNTGCPIGADPIVEEEQNDAGQDPDITIAYDLATTTGQGEVIYEYEVMITNTSNQAKSNLVLYNVVPEMQLPYAEFTAATIPGVQINLTNGTVTLPQIQGGQTVSVFVTVTMPN